MTIWDIHCPRIFSLIVAGIKSFQLVDSADQPKVIATTDEKLVPSAVAIVAVNPVADWLAALNTMPFVPTIAEDTLQVTSGAVLPNRPTG